MLHWTTGDCRECDWPVVFTGSYGYPQGLWLHSGGPFSGEEADIRFGHAAAPKGETCPCCGRLVDSVVADA